MTSHSALHSARFAAVLLLFAGIAHAQTALGSGKGNPSYPILITQSGSYKLSSNLIVPAGSNGIVVGNGLDVSIDLNGFAIIGAAVCSKAGCAGAPPTTGIRVGDSSARIVNGAVRGFGYNGIGLDEAAQNGRLTVDSVHLSRNYNGLLATHVLATRVTAENNAQWGIASYHGVIADSVAISNGTYGFRLGGGTLRGNYAFDNNYGFLVGSVGWSALYEGNAASANPAGNIKHPGSVAGFNAGL